jgi:hypothetical protein
VTDAKRKQAIEAAHSNVTKVPHFASAVDPFSQQGQAQISKDKQTAFIPVLLDVDGDELTQQIAQSVLDAGEPGREAGMRVAVGGLCRDRALGALDGEQRADRLDRSDDDLIVIRTTS